MDGQTTYLPVSISHYSLCVMKYTLFHLIVNIDHSHAIKTNKMIRVFKFYKIFWCNKLSILPFCSEAHLLLQSK